MLITLIIFLLVSANSLYTPYPTYSCPDWKYFTKKERDKCVLNRAGSGFGGHRLAEQGLDIGIPMAFVLHLRR